MKHELKQLCMALLVCTCGAGSLTAQNHPINSNSFMEEKLTLDFNTRMGQGVPEKRQSEPHQGNFPQPLRHHISC